MPAVTVVADDLTGALDTGVQFAGGDRVVTVVWRPGSGAGDVLVCDTESRSLRPSAAAAAVEEWARLAGGLVYKKMDSTLRGPFAAEAAVLALALGRRGALICPAFPAAGRTIVDGTLLVDGTPVHLAGFAADPGWPVTESDVAAVVRSQVGRSVGRIDLAQVRTTPEELAAALGQRRGLVVADAESDADLSTLAQALLNRRDWLPVGSAGLAGALARQMGYGAPAASAAGLGRGYVLVCGSANPVSRRQMEGLSQSTGAPLFEAEPGAVWPATADAKRDFRRAGLLALAVSRRRLSPAEARQARRTLVGRARLAVEKWGATGLYATGGQTLRLLLDALGIDCLHPRLEVEPGVVLSTATLPGGRSLEVTSKAGGFGDDDLLVRLFGTGDDAGGH